jgi:TRAP-type C4-dicarboxylate transport system permease small subunit
MTIRARLLGVERWSLRAERLVAFTALLGILVAVCLQVLSRNLMTQPIGGTDEAARVLQVLLTFVGASIGVALESHPAMPSVFDLSRGRVAGTLHQGATRGRTKSLIGAIIVAAVSVVVVGGAVAAMERRGSLTVLPLPSWIVYAAALAGLFGVVLHQSLLLLGTQRPSPGTSSPTSSGVRQDRVNGH